MWPSRVGAIALLLLRASAMEVIVRNEIPAKADSSCPACVTSIYVPDFNVKVFASGQVNINRGQEATFDINMNFAGLGLQVNGFYFGFDPDTGALAADLSTDANDHQNLNPDNAGAQIYLNKDCSFSRVTAPWSGIGVPSYVVADFSSERQGSACKVTVRANDDTYRLSTFNGVPYRGFNSGFGISDGVPDEDQNKIAAGCFLDASSYKASWSSISFQPQTFAIGSAHGNVEAPTYSCSTRSSPPALTTTPVLPASTSPPGGLCEEGGSVWHADADGYSCGSRITWVQLNLVAGDLQAAQARVAAEYPGSCGACASESPQTAAVAATEPFSGTRLLLL